MYKDFVMMKYYDTSKKDERAAALASDNYALQLKLDGAGYILGVDADGIPHLNNGKMSKKTNSLIDKIDNVPHIKQWAVENMPPESQLCVELYYHYDWTSGQPVYNEREESRYLNSIMLSLPPKAIARQNQSELVHVHIFDCLFWNGEEVYKKDFADRWTLVNTTWEKLFHQHTSDWEIIDSSPEWINIAETIYEDKAEAIAEWLSSGKEGGVLKMLHSAGKVDASYHTRPIGSTPARPRHTSYKIKEVDTVDAVITSIIPASKAYTGKDPENHPFRDEDGTPVNRLWKLGYPGSFGIGFYNKEGELVETGSCNSGLTDEMRKEMAADPEAFIGLVVELVAMSKDNVAGTLRHPRLKQIRDDKEATECTFEVTFN